MLEISKTRAEDAVANTNAFLQTELDTTMDGDFAGRQVAARVASVAERAAHLLGSVPHPQASGYYVPLSRHNANCYDEAVAVLPGYFVLVPSRLVERGTSVFYPAVVSEDGLKTQKLRLHVLHWPYRQQASRHGSAIVLSAAGQSETPGVGEHGRKPNDGVEAEHFATLLAASSDDHVRSAWQAGEHINHTWRAQADNSVVAATGVRLFGERLRQSTVTLTQWQVATGQAMLLWHEGMRDSDSGQPETATRDNALVVMQGLGFEAVQGRDPQAIDQVRKMLA